VEDTGKCGQDLLIAAYRRGTLTGRALRSFALAINQRNYRGKSDASYQCLSRRHVACRGLTAPATPTPTAKPSKRKLTADRLKEMKAKWSANKGKLAVCRKEVKSKGLAGDDRWFYIEDCMGKP
jgi:hypothetical protein